MDKIDELQQSNTIHVHQSTNTEKPYEMDEHTPNCVVSFKRFH